MAKATKKILIVEDDKDFLWILRQNFELEGIPVLFALNGEEGLAMAIQEKPDLIMMDILMPKMDGLAMAKELKKNGVDAQLVFLTNFKDTDHISKAMETVGEVDYMIKSDVHIDEIITRI